MKKRSILIATIISLALISTGCGESKIEKLEENINKIDLTGNLVTYQAYYHNVIEYDKKAGTGITHFLEKDRKLFAEYTGTIKLGIDLSDVEIDVRGNQIDVYLPKAKVIGEPNVNKDDFKAENFIESKEGINKNPINANDSNGAFNKAQKNMKDAASKDEELLLLAQKRAKVILEENILQFSGLKENDIRINWEYGQ